MTLQVNELDHRDAAPIVSPFTRVLTQPEPDASPYRNGGKRFFDVALVVLSLPVVLPLILLLACIVALDGHNPFYTQNRVGRNGRIFRLIEHLDMLDGFAGARVIFQPSAFTLYTGKDHWEPLIRARAIENQVYMVSPAQIGVHAGDQYCFGNAMIAKM